MTKAKIYLIDDKTGSRVEYQESGYVAEAYLQEFIQQYPDLLPGDQINPDDPRRWLLVSREMGVPGADHETGRWSLDHLFVDQDGIPTFVECKRSVDTRARREVVAQMLDYAANGVEYWNIDRIRQEATETAQAIGKSLDDEVFTLLGEEDDDIEAFWSTVDENLRKHRVRLIFVSDHAPSELRRLVEFLNEEMTNVEVLIVEVKQYKRNDSDTERALVPRVIGLTETARAIKASTSKGPRRQTNRTEFLSKCLPEAREFFEVVLDTAKQQGYIIYWGIVGFSVRGKLGEGDSPVSFVYGFPENRFEFFFDTRNLINREKDSPFRKELLDFGLFNESGDYTLKSYITPENKDAMVELYKHIIKRIKEFEVEFHPELEKTR